jgi:hypothetical protein
MLTYAHVCSRMLTHSSAEQVVRDRRKRRGAPRLQIYCTIRARSKPRAVDVRVGPRCRCHRCVCSRMLTYAHVCSRMLTFEWDHAVVVTGAYAHVCSRMLTYAHVCSRSSGTTLSLSQARRYSRMLTYAHVCSRMLTFVWDHDVVVTGAYPHVCSRMLAYADVCRRMLTYADVCLRMLTYADEC